MPNQPKFERSLKNLKPVALLVLAHAPFLFLYFQLLNGLDHYGFFPFALAAFAYLCYDRIDSSRFRWNRLSTALIAIDLLLVVAGVVVASSWPVWLGLCCGASALCLATGDRTQNSSLLYATLPLWILVRPPFSMDLELVGWLQKKTTLIASSILHRLQIVHFRSGNVLEFGNKTLLVEEACSGIQSLFAVLFVAVTVIAFYRRRLIQACALIPFAFLCAAVFNVVRVLCIAIAWNRWQWDLSSGLSHTILGYICLLAATLMVLSADQMIATVTNPIPRSKSIKGFKADIVGIWNWFFEPHEKPDSDRRARRSILSAPRFLTSSAITVGVASLLFVGQVYAGFLRTDVATSNIQLTTDSLKRTDIPDDLGDWKQASYAVETRGVGNSFGQFSNSWRYNNEHAEAFISCDYAFRGWHNLEVCYQGRGWVIERRSIITNEADSTADWSAVEVSFTKPTGEHSFLIYSLFDAGAAAVAPPGSSISASVFDRVFRRSSLQSTNARTIQAQIFVETAGPVSGEDREELLKQHQTTRELLRSRYQELINE